MDQILVFKNQNWGISSCFLPNQPPEVDEVQADVTYFYLFHYQINLQIIWDLQRLSDWDAAIQESQITDHCIS